jgi:hypothetical protein
MSHKRPRKELGPYSVGEIPRPIEVQFLDAEGAALAITGFDAEFIIEQISGTAAAGLGAGTASIADGPTGVAQYAWAAADFAQAGRYQGQMWVGDGTNRLASVELWWDVLDLTAAPAI